MTLRSLLGDLHGLLLDFDGPICKVFAGLPDYVAAQRLRLVLTSHDVVLKGEVAATHDPLQVLRFTGEHHPNLGPAVEHELQRLELEAVETARPTPGAFDVIRYAPSLCLAIVSNNSAAAIGRYFDLHRRALGAEANPAVIGRNPLDPRLMKPNPHPLVLAMREVAVQPTACVFVGDSAADVEAANAAHVRAVGYANKPGKRAMLLEAGAVEIIEGMTQLADALQAVRRFSQGSAGG